MSQDLIWQLVKNNNSFLIKRDGHQFSTEAGNLKNVNSYKYSGLANKRAIDVRALPAGGVSVGLKKANRGGQQKPAKTYTRVNLAKVDLKRAARKVGNIIRKASVKGHYRRDLSKVALARWTNLHLSLRRSAGQLPKANVGPRRFIRASKKVAAPAKKQ